MKNSLPLAITKMSGAGNTFALLDGRKNSAWKNVEKNLGKSRPEFAKLICDKVLGIATDGLLIIEEGSDGFDFNWDFYNNDGSTAEMCGNAARCAARFCFETISAQKNIRFKTGAGLVTAQIFENGKIHIKMPAAKVLKDKVELISQPGGAKEAFVLVNTGVPHLVQKIHNFGDTRSLKEMAREMRSHADLKPSGANVTFYAEDEIGKIMAVTFERGVEDYTLACGTGAVAAALVCSRDSKVNEVQVQMPGGVMEVHFFANDPCPLLIGDAVFVGDFQYNLEVMR